MSDGNEKVSSEENGTPSNSGRTVYLAPQVLHEGDELTIQDLVDILWSNKLLILLVTSCFLFTSISFALLTTEWYRSEVVLVPAESKSTVSLPGALGTFGGLAGLAGISVGGGESAEAIAILRSRDFARSFINDRDLLHILMYNEWDAATETWKEAGDEVPDIRDAVKVFREDVLRVSEDSKSGLVTLSIDWLDPDIAADWASDIAFRLNERMRGRALQEAEENVAYLTEQLSATSLAMLQRSIGAVLETELQKLMLAKGNDEFAFRTIDSANVPKKRIRPKRTILVLAATSVGFILAFFVSYFRESEKYQKRAGSDHVK